MTDSVLPRPLDRWPEDRPVPLDHPDLPPAIREAVRAIYEPGYELFRVETEDGVEWWLLDVTGELIDGFWLEDE